MNVCTHIVKTVRLVDGSIAPGDCEEWRAECEARAVLAIRSKGARYHYLNRVQERRGKEARDRLHSEALRVWRLSRANHDESG